MSPAIWIRDIGGPDVMKLEDHDPGEPGEGCVRVRNRAAGVNFIDVYFRTGLYPRPLPFVAGLEGAGSVEAVGRSVEGLSVGGRVAWA
jgi:NADPH2:quinone reductase